ncbi:hypothetical protein SPFM10_00159 [Salmonella phage SPFM10]|nr:hypothetical protein SPFM10_00159 [Salmonella phage SPFM10]
MSLELYRLRKMGIHARIGIVNVLDDCLKSPTDVNLIKLKVITLYDYPEGKVPQEALDKLNRDIGEAVKQLSNIDGYTFRSMSRVIGVARPMRLNRTPMSRYG